MKMSCCPDKFSEVTQKQQNDQQTPEPKPNPKEPKHHHTKQTQYLVVFPCQKLRNTTCVSSTLVSYGGQI